MIVGCFQPSICVPITTVIVVHTPLAPTRHIAARARAMKVTPVMDLPAQVRTDYFYTGEN